MICQYFSTTNLSPLKAIMKLVPVVAEEEVIVVVHIQ